MGKKQFCFFQTAETGNRTPDSGVKGSGANHYPRAPALQLCEEKMTHTFSLILHCLTCSCISFIYGNVVRKTRRLQVVMETEKHHGNKIWTKSNWRKLDDNDRLRSSPVTTFPIMTLNFHPLEVVSRWRDPQLQVSENYTWFWFDPF